MIRQEEPAEEVGGRLEADVGDRSHSKAALLLITVMIGLTTFTIFGLRVMNHEAFSGTQNWIYAQQLGVLAD